MAKSIFISGARTGLGAALARKLAQRGWQVFAGVSPGKDTSQLTEGVELTPVEQDVRDDESVFTSARMVSSLLNGEALDVLVNNAGVGVTSKPVEAVDLDEARLLLEVNMFGPLRVCRAFLPLLHDSRNSPRILNISSGAARVAVPCNAIYNMSKCSLEGLTNTLRMELLPFGIQTTSVEPGAIKTAMTENALEKVHAAWELVPEPVRQRYEAKLRPLTENLARRLELGNEPNEIADEIIALLDVTTLKSRYLVGKDMKRVGPMQKLLPELTFERMIMKQYFG